jgi:hypothetical protein
MDAAAWSQKVGVVLRIAERAIRTWPLNEWALLRRVLPDGGSSDPDPRRFMPDKGSSLAFDDLGFMPGLGDHVVSATARFPVMMATENLVGAAQVHGAAFQQRRTNVASVASLCRCANVRTACDGVSTLQHAAGDPMLISRRRNSLRCIAFSLLTRLPPSAQCRAASYSAASFRGSSSASRHHAGVPTIGHDSIWSSSGATCS